MSSSSKGESGNSTFNILSYLTSTAKTTANPNFSNSSIVNETLEFEPNHSIQYRFIFTPTTESTYHQSIDFLVNQTLLIHVILRGVGVKNKLLVEESVTYIDFKTVHVGDVISETFRVTNTCPKEIPMNLFDVDQLIVGNNQFLIEDESVANDYFDEVQSEINRYSISLLSSFRCHFSLYYFLLVTDFQTN